MLAVVAGIPRASSLLRCPAPALGLAADRLLSNGCEPCYSFHTRVSNHFGRLKLRVMASKPFRATSALKSGVVYGGGALLNTINSLTPHLAGAVDIMVVEQPDGTLKSTPFYVRFGKYTQYRNKDRVVRLYVNGELIDFQMYLGTYGQAFFAAETAPCLDDEEQHLNDIMSPTSGYSSGEEADILTAVEEQVNLHKLETAEGTQTDLGSSDGQPFLGYANQNFMKDGATPVDKDLDDEARLAAHGFVDKPVSEAPAVQIGFPETVPALPAAATSSLPSSGAAQAKSLLSSSLRTPLELSGTPVEDIAPESNIAVMEFANDAPQPQSQSSNGILAPTNTSIDGQSSPTTQEPVSMASLPSYPSAPALGQRTVGAIDSNSSNSSAAVPVSKASAFTAPDALDCAEEAVDTMDAISPSAIYGVSPNDPGYMTDLDVGRGTGFSPSPIKRNNNKHGLFGLQGFDLSMCGLLLKTDMSYSEAQQVFEAHKVSAEVFAARGKALLDSGDLVCRIGDVMYPWRDAAPMIVGMLAFGVKWENLMPAGVPCWRLDGQQLESIKSGPRPRRTWLWPFAGWKERSNSKAPTGTSPPLGKSPPNPNNLATVSAPALQRLETPPSMDGDIPYKHVILKKTLTPTNEQLKSMKLKEGQNTIQFKTGPATELRAYVYFLKWNTRIVISDIDGTITKSDILGHVLPAIGMDWSHAGITRLYNNIRTNGYMMMYLSSRAISQANITRDFIHKLVQGGTQMPLGPVIISPHGLLPSLYREMILRRPHEFKIACLQDIRALFPPDWNPFYAGFGNRETDVISYKEVGVPLHRIFTINPRGELRKASLALVSSTWATLHAINELVHDVFPALDSRHAIEDSQTESFHDLSYWGGSSYQVNIEELEAKEKASKEKEAKDKLLLEAKEKASKEKEAKDKLIKDKETKEKEKLHKEKEAKDAKSAPASAHNSGPLSNEGAASHPTSKSDSGAASPTSNDQGGKKDDSDGTQGGAGAGTEGAGGAGGPAVNGGLLDRNLSSKFSDSLSERTHSDFIMNYNPFTV